VSRSADAGGPGERPNVLVVMCDELKATALGLYGDRVLRTPNLERLAASGLLYERAFTTHPLCVPARASFWTGRYPHSTGCRTNQTLLPSRDSVRHMARVWWEAGYTTGVAGKNHCFTGEDERRFGLIADGWGQRPGAPGSPEIAAARAARPDHRFAGAADSWVAPYKPEHSGTWQIAERAVEFLETRAAEGAAGGPWGLWVSFNDPHPPFQAPEPYASRFPPDRVSLPPWRPNELADKPQRQRVFAELMGLADVPEEDVRRVIGIYYAMTALVDDALGTILDALERTGQRERTIVLFTADHGDFVGEHCLMEKGGMLYDALVRVPLILSWPGRLPAGERVASVSSLVDVAPTLLWLQGLEIPRDVQGQPLVGISWEDFGPARLEPAAAYAERAAPASGVFLPHQRPPVTGGAAVSSPEPTWAQPGAVPAPREAVFAEYGAGGAPVTLARLADTPEHANRRRIHTLLLEREAEGRPKMVRTHRWKYVYDPLDPDGVEELYDCESDPHELTNLASSGDPTHRGARARLRDLLVDWSLSTEDPVPVPFAF
jgi:arylsulfatase A-like enzyme